MRLSILSKKQIFKYFISVLLLSNVVIADTNNEISTKARGRLNIKNLDIKNLDIKELALVKNNDYAKIKNKLELKSHFLNQKKELLIGIGRTLDYLHTDKSKTDYEKFSEFGFSRDKVKLSLRRFFVHVIQSKSEQELRQKIIEDFSLYRSRGYDGKGSVKFTGYFQPVYKASRTRKGKYQYPVFRRPEDFYFWPEESHPTRIQLEGYQGKGGGDTLLGGYEIAYLNNRFETFMIHIQGSAILEFEDGERISIGFKSGTNYPFRGVSKSFMNKHNVKWNKLNEFFVDKPELINEIMAENNRFIFFEEKPSTEPIGSLGIPVIAEQSIATDSKVLPPGGIGIIQARLPIAVEGSEIKFKLTSRLVLNLDTGSAIKGPGRVDVFMGTGDEALKKASALYTKGELFYLLLNNT